MNEKLEKEIDAFNKWLRKMLYAASKVRKHDLKVRALKHKMAVEKKLLAKLNKTERDA